VLEAAAKKDLIELPQTIDKLRQTNFHVALIQRVLKSDAQRRGKAGT
jgi:hypothetical protein